MAWGSVSSGGTLLASTGLAVRTLTPTEPCSTSGRMAVLGIANISIGSTSILTGNQFTGVGGTPIVTTTVNDAAGNTWRLAGEQGVDAATNAGTRAFSLWWANVTNAISSGAGGNITITHPVTCDAVAVLWYYSYTAGNNVSCAASTGLVNVSSLMGAMDITGLSTGTYLRVRGGKVNAGSTFNPTVGWSSWSISPQLAAEYSTSSASTLTSNPTTFVSIATTVANVYAIWQETVPEPDFIMGQVVL